MKYIFTLTTIVLLAIVGCKKDKDKTDPIGTEDNAAPSVFTNSEVILHYDEAYQFVIINGSDTLNTMDYTWTASNTKVGTIDSTGLFTARKVGELTVSASKGASTISAKVTVAPYENTFTEPLAVWRATMDDVKSYEKRKLSDSGEELLIYEGENRKLRGVIYLFEKGFLYGSMVLFENSSSVVEETINFYKERYPKHGYSNGIAHFTDDEGVTVGVSYDDRFGYCAVYVIDEPGTERKTPASERFSSALKEAALIMTK